MEIDVADTVLGKHRAVQKREMMASVATMSKEELDELQKKIDSCKTLMMNDAVQTKRPRLNM